MTKPKKVTDAGLRNLKYGPLESKGLKVDGAISKRTGKPMESRPGQLLPNRYPDECGMYVNVAPTGRVTFRYSYRWPKTTQGRRQLVTYGDTQSSLLRRLGTSTSTSSASCAMASTR